MGHAALRKLICALAPLLVLALSPAFAQQPSVLHFVSSPTPQVGDCLAISALNSSGVTAADAGTGACGNGGGGGSGTVTSVALSGPAWLTIGGSPITTSGTIAITAATGQTANFVLATPNGSSGALSPRALVLADLPTNLGTPSAINLTNATGFPTLNQNTTGTAAGLAGTPTTGEYWGYNGTSQGWYTPSGSGTVSSCSAGQLAYYSATGTTVTCLTLGTNLSVTTGTLNAAGGGSPPVGSANEPQYYATSSTFGGMSGASTAGYYGTYYSGTPSSTAPALVLLDFSQLGSATNPNNLYTSGFIGPTGGGHVSSDEGNGTQWPTSCTGFGGWSSSGTPDCITPSGAIVVSSGQAFTEQQTYSPTLTSNAYTVLSTDWSKLLTFDDASAVTLNLPVATTSGFGAGFFFYAHNYGAGTITVTPTTSTIGGYATIAITQNADCKISSDGTNYQVGPCDAVASSGGGTAQNVQLFTSSGTWTKPSGSPQATQVLCTGGGGGGGSGSDEASGTESTGGGGGGGASTIRQTFPTSSLSGTVTVTVGTGGVGGAAQSSATAGNNGSNGNSTTFGPYLTAYGGGSGQGGTTATASGGGAGAGLLGAASGTSAGAMCAGAHGAGTVGGSPTCEGGGGGGGGGPASGIIGTAGGSTVVGASGGGAGGGIGTGVVAAAGGASGAAGSAAAASGGAASSAGSAGNAPSNYGGGTGGGGGGASTTGNAATGGVGSLGGGGGGGGAGLFGTGSSGAGGAGGNGQCVVRTTF